MQEGEVAARILVGSTAGYMAMQYDKERQEKKLGVYEIEGKVTSEFDTVIIEVTRMIKLSVIQDPRYSDDINNHVA